MRFSIEQLLFGLIVIIGILQLILLFRLVRLLRGILEQIQDSRSESRTLSRNLMSTVQDASRSLVMELREEFEKQSREGSKHVK